MKYAINIVDKGWLVSYRGTDVKVDSKQSKAKQYTKASANRACKTLKERGFPAMVHDFIVTPDNEIPKDNPLVMNVTKSWGVNYLEHNDSKYFLVCYYPFKSSETRESEVIGIEKDKVQEAMLWSYEQYTNTKANEELKELINNYDIKENDVFHIENLI